VKRKPKFRVGQVVAYRADRGQWEYDRIGQIRLAGDHWDTETAWLVMNTARIETKYLRTLTDRERGKP
jgi:hypothetical protein